MPSVMRVAPIASTFRFPLRPERARVRPKRPRFIEKDVGFRPLDGMSASSLPFSRGRRGQTIRHNFTRSDATEAPATALRATGPPKREACSPSLSGWAEKFSASGFRSAGGSAASFLAASTAFHWTDQNRTSCQGTGPKTLALPFSARRSRCPVGPEEAPQPSPSQPARSRP